jgi:hypothetical protein
MVLRNSDESMVILSTAGSPATAPPKAVSAHAWEIVPMVREHHSKLTRVRKKGRILQNPSGAKAQLI